MIAAVAVDISLPHLDRTFDYRVPADLESSIAVGCRVRVVFAGRLVSGIVLELHDDPSRATADIRAVSSSAVVLSTRMANLVRAVADRYGSTFADVVRFAVPSRHAKAEAAALEQPALNVSGDGELTGCWREVRGGEAFFTRAARGEAVSACVEIPTRRSLIDDVAAAVRVASAAMSVIVVAPDARDVDRIAARLTELGLAPVVMRAGDGPSIRQRAFTNVATAERVVVVGTRSAVFAPVQGSGLTIVVGDGNDSLVETQTPGWHAREVALLRTDILGWSSLFVARHRSIELQRDVELGRVRALQWTPEQWRTQSVRVEAVAERYDDADPMLQRLRIPPSVFKAVRVALQQGSVVLSVAHRGYVTSLRCQGCRERARCSECQGPLGLAGSSAVPRCGWCGRSDGAWKCPWCGDQRMRNQTIGVERTMEEVGRAFPDTPVRVVDADHPLEAIPKTPHLLFVTPGMEPAGAAALAVVLDADTILARHDLAAATEAVRRWCDVAATVGADGRVLLVGQASAPAVQALVRSDPIGFAERELEQRRSAGLPPAVHAAIVVAPPKSTAAHDIAAQCAGARVLGPVPAGNTARWVVLHEDRAVLAHAVRAVMSTYSAAKTLTGVSVRIDPLELPT